LTGVEEDVGSANPRRWRDLRVGAAIAAVALVGWFVVHRSSPEPEVVPRVVLIDSAQVLRLPSTSDPRLVLSGSHQLVQGQFVTAAADWMTTYPRTPEGFLLRVIGSDVSHGETTVQTQPASLFAAVPSGEIDTAGSNFHSLTPARALARAPARAQIASAPADDSGEVELPLEAEGPFECGQTGTIEIGRAIETAFDPHFDMAWGSGHRLRRTIKHASAWLDGGMSVTVSATTGGTAHCELKPIVLVEPSLTTVVFIGHVPVPITVGLPVSLSASAKAEGTTTASVGAGLRGRLGLEYTDQAVNGIKDVRKERPRVTPSTSAAASAEATIGPAVALEVGWRVASLGKLAAVAKIDVRGGVSVEYDAAHPPLRTCIPFRVSGSIEFHLVRRKLGPLNQPIYGTDLKCVPPKSTPDR